MTKVDRLVQMDEATWQRVDGEAAQLGRTSDEVLEETVRRALAAQRLTGLLTRIGERSSVTDDEASELAYREIDAARAL